MSISRAALFCDRDGTLIVDKGYGVTPGDVELVPGVGNALILLSQIRLPMVIVTNQSAIARGLTTSAVTKAVNGRLMAELKARHVEVLDVMVCPHTPEDRCNCRKPEPGLFWQAAHRHNIDLFRSFMIGDKFSDRQAALRAGIRQAFVVDAENSLLDVIRHVVLLHRNEAAV